MLILPAKPNRGAPNAMIPNGGVTTFSTEDSAASSDAFVSAMVMRPAFSDTVTATDSTAKTHGMVQADTVVATDWTKVRRGRSETDFAGA